MFMQSFFYIRKNFIRDFPLLVYVCLYVIRKKNSKIFLNNFRSLDTTKLTGIKTTVLLISTVKRELISSNNLEQILLEMFISK